MPASITAMMCRGKQCQTEWHAENNKILKESHTALKKTGQFKYVGGLA